MSSAAGGPATAAVDDLSPGRDFDQALTALCGVEGWLSTDQAWRLWKAARALTAPARIVEIGSFRGRSIIVLALAAAPGVEVVAIDPHLGSDRGPREIRARSELGAADHVAFLDNLRRAGVADRVRHVRRRSEEALAEVQGGVDLLYVDGAHRFAPARSDLERWGARVAPGGRLFVHDAFSSVGVTLALLCSVVGRRGWRYLGRTGSLAEYEHGAATAAQRCADALSGAAQLPWFTRNLAVKLLIVARLQPLARLLGHRSGPWPY